MASFRSKARLTCFPVYTGHSLPSSSHLLTFLAGLPSISLLASGLELAGPGLALRPLGQGTLAFPTLRLPQHLHLLGHSAP